MGTARVLGANDETERIPLLVAGSDVNANAFIALYAFTAPGDIPIPRGTPIDGPPPAPDEPQQMDVAAAPVTGAESITVALTFYNCYGQGGGYCGGMSSGVGVYEGAAACGDALHLGTRFTIVEDYTGRVYTCEDRGLGPYDWIDIFFWDYATGRAWRDQFGERVEIELR